MTKKVAHRGEALKEAVDRSGLKKEAVAKAAGYSRAAYYAHIAERNLSDQVLERYAKVLGEELLEQWGILRYVRDQDREYKTSTALKEALAEADMWKSNFLMLRAEVDKLEGEVKRIKEAFSGIS